MSSTMETNVKWGMMQIAKLYQKIKFFFPEAAFGPIWFNSNSFGIGENWGENPDKLWLFHTV